MERDFMGLTVKQETPDEPIDAAPVRSLAMQWSFSNKGSPRQLLSFQEEKPKTGFDSLASTGLVTITTAEAVDSDLKPYPGSVQKSTVLEKRGIHYAIAGYPSKPLDSHTIHHPVTAQPNLKVSPVAVHQSFGQTRVCPVVLQPLAGVPMSNQVPAVSSPVVGTTDLRSTSKIAGATAQLTIFYNGSVCVYDNISPEKAQAIMLLAGNGPPMISGVPPPATPVQASTPKSSSPFDAFFVSQPYSITAHRQNPGPVASISVSHSAARSGPNNDAAIAKPAGVLVSPPEKAEPLRVANPIRSSPMAFLSPDTVPQFRKKSLARFLEKRKERVISSSPYGEKQSPDCSTPGSGSCPVQAVN